MVMTTEITVSVSRTFNLGNYESVRIEASAKVSRNEDSDTPATLRDAAMTECQTILNEARREFVPRKGPRE